MKAELHKFHLSKVYRQKDPIDAHLLARIRTGTQTDKDLERINLNVVQKPPVGSTILGVFNKLVDRVNQEELCRVNGDSHHLHAKRTGTHAKKWPDGNYKKAAPLPERILLREGCKVLIRKNGKCKDDCGCDLQFVNGDSGIFLGMESKRSNKLLIQRKDGAIIKLPPLEAKDSIYVVEKAMEEQEDELGMRHLVEVPKIREDVKGRFKQYPISLGYAMTIAKSQGQTIERVHIELPNAQWLAEKKPIGLIYTALSRVTSLNNLTLNRPLVHSDIHARDGLNTIDQQFDFGL